MNLLLRHMVVMPVLIPLLAAALMLFLAESRRTARLTLALGSVLAQLSIGGTLLYLTSGAAACIWLGGGGVLVLVGVGVKGEAVLVGALVGVLVGVAAVNWAVYVVGLAGATMLWVCPPPSDQDVN